MIYAIVNGQPGEEEAFEKNRGRCLVAFQEAFIAKQKLLNS